MHQRRSGKQGFLLWSHHGWSGEDEPDGEKPADFEWTGIRTWGCHHGASWSCADDPKHAAVRPDPVWTKAGEADLRTDGTGPCVGKWIQAAGGAE